MLEARSVAVVGASERVGSVGHETLVELMEGGFDGAVYPVNPKYKELLGHRCYPSLADLPEPCDLAIIALANRLLEESLASAAALGVGSTVIFASGYESPREGVPPLTERLAAIARQAGMAICGGNCMGFINVERRLRASGWYEPKPLDPGGITLVSHAGSVFAALLHNDRKLRFNLAVSSGQELVTTTADYLHYALDLESTRAIALFIETVRDVTGFRAALDRASELDVPVVALKVGREALTREMVTAHSGALAGEDAAYEALFGAHGVLRVASLGEMADTLALFVAGRRAGPGGLASIHESGGERAMIVDAAAAVGVPLAEVSRKTADRIGALLEEGLLPVNPLDFWGTGRDSFDVITGCMRALLDDPAVAALAFTADLIHEKDPMESYVGMFLDVWPRTEKPMAMLSNFSNGIDRQNVDVLNAAGPPVLEDTLTGLAAFRHLFAYRDHRGLPPVEDGSPVSPQTLERWRLRLGSGAPIDELEGLSLLSDYGIPVVKARVARTFEEAMDAAAELAWPVAVKTAAREVTHKSDVDGVRLGVRGAPALKAAYEDLRSRLGPEVTVARMAPSGVEMALGIVRDRQFGPLVLVAAGGILVELLRDRRLALPPLDQERARRMIDRLTVRPMLGAFRGQPPADVGSAARALVAMSWLARDLGEQLEALDVNPVIVGPQGCVAVDVLVIPRA
jgi:acetate---CoA ligase (ADP-forming)